MGGCICSFQIMLFKILNFEFYLHFSLTPFCMCHKILLERIQLMHMNTQISRFLRFLDSISPPNRASAHCDVPCGVYETDSAKWAAETCDKLVHKLLHDVHAPDPKDPAYVHYLNTVTRTVQVKEEFAQICKEQVLILWTDYFKPEHLEKWPDLHEKIWKTTKQCSTVKRTVDEEETKKLKAMVDEIAKIFADSKK